MVDPRPCPDDQRWRRAAPLLADAVRVVRIQAADDFGGGATEPHSDADRVAFTAATAELIASERCTADRPEGRSGPHRDPGAQGKVAEAERGLWPLSTLVLRWRSDNIADLYRSHESRKDAEQLLRETIAIDPRAAAPHHPRPGFHRANGCEDEATQSLKAARSWNTRPAHSAYCLRGSLTVSPPSNRPSEAVWRMLSKANPSNMEVLLPCSFNPR